MIKQSKCTDIQVRMLADTGATLTKALEIDLDLSAVLGSVRYNVYIAMCWSYLKILVFLRSKISHTGQI